MSRIKHIIKLGGHTALWTSAVAFLFLGMWVAAKNATSQPEPMPWFFIQRPSAPTIDYKDFISILLTGLGLMIAIGAFFIGVLAVWGYKEAKSLVAKTVEERATAEVGDQLSRLLTPELIATALKSDPSLLITAARETNDTLFGDVDSSEAEEIVEALDIGANERS